MDQLVWIAIVLTTVVGPITLALLGLFSRERSAGVRADLSATISPMWPLLVNSTLAYALAFNLIFFLQELFLVLPKAFTPGLRPTLYHNNHTWTGDHPLGALWQGTGVLAIITAGCICLAVLPPLRGRSNSVRLLVLWFAYHGLIMGLAQVPVGALSPRSDLGMAMTYLALAPATKALCAIGALIAIVLVAVHLTRRAFEFAATREQLGTARLRNRFVLHAATLPALLGTILIVPFRVPRELVEVLGPPVVVAIVGTSWMQASAWLRRDRLVVSGATNAVAWPLAIALLVVFALFHLVLARGVEFSAPNSPSSALARSSASGICTSNGRLRASSQRTTRSRSARLIAVQPLVATPGAFQMCR